MRGVQPYEVEVCGTCYVTSVTSPRPSVGRGCDFKYMYSNINQIMSYKVLIVATP